MALNAKKIHRQLAEKAEQYLEKREWRGYLREALERTLEARKTTIETMFPDWEGFRDTVRQTRQHAVENLEELFKTFKQNCEKRGVKVYLAENGEEACRIVYRIAAEKNAKLLTKSKSMTMEEIELTPFLESKGLKVVETDLGEFIIQLSGERPFHMVYPAVHKTRREIAELFSAVAGRILSDDLNELVSFVREHLREVFLSADIGLTGANIAVAETGTVVVETNEGNDRLGSVPPKTHIVVMGMEKIVESVEDALRLVVAHPVSSTGQPLTTYVSFISGRNPMAGVFDGRELHVVVVDNGRTQMRADSLFKEALYCIRCGACMNICPTYSTVGGYVFGHIYTGPIGIPWTAYVHGLDKAAQFTELCVSCGLCKEICPAEIDMPMMIAKVKHRVVKEAGQLGVNSLLESYESIYKLGSRFPKLFNLILRNKPVRYLMEKLAGIDSRRQLPPIADKSLTEIVKGRKSEVNEQVVALFADFYYQFVRPDLGLKLIEAIEECGFSVLLPSQRSSGYPYVAYGDLDKAREIAYYNVESLHMFAEKGSVIVSIEPTATYSLKYVYPFLLNNSEKAKKVSSSAVSATEFLCRLVEEGTLKIEKTGKTRIAVHIPCHERALDSSKSAHKLLTSAGYDAFFVETGTCCGMAGSFGMKHGVLGYELSNVVGESLFDKLSRSGCEIVATTSSVCRIHIEEATGLPVRHPLELITFTFQRKR